MAQSQFRRSIGAMDYGLILPSLGGDATREGIDAAGEIAERLGFTRRVDDGPPPRGRERAPADYGRIYEAVTTLAYLAGRTTRVRLGASVIVVPMRNAVVLAKELATIDNLSNGRLIAGVGVGWSRAEFANVGVADRFAVRGAYTEETIALWRHLWSGSDRAVPRAVPRVRRLRLRAAPGAGRRPSDLARRALRAGPPADRPGRRWVSRHVDGPRQRTRSESRSSGRPPRPPAGRCRACRPASASS